MEDRNKPAVDDGDENILSQYSGNVIQIKKK